MCENPTWVDLKGKDATPETVHHAMVMIDDDESVDVDALSPRAVTDNVHAFDDVKNDPAARRSQRTKLRKPHALKAIVDKYNMDQCLIFCRTNFDCYNLETFLNTIGGDGGRKHAGRKLEKGPQNPYSCVVLGGARSMEERRRNLKLFKEGNVRFLVCTDVAARGLDIKGLPFVVNMTLPDRSEDYVHRVGRVGRADTYGLAISLVSAAKEKVWYCSMKWHKPWFNPTREDCATHVAWYDEPKLLKEIEARLGGDVKALNADYSLPASIAGGGGGGGGGGGIVYGQRRGNEESAETCARLEAYAPAVRRLAQLEFEAQASFWSLKRKFAT